MAYDHRNAGSAIHNEYLDPISPPDYNSWQGQNPSGHPGGYHGGYQQAPMPPPIDTASQNKQVAAGWEWPDWDDSDAMTNGFTNTVKPRTPTKKVTPKPKPIVNQLQPQPQPQLQNPSLFFDNFSAENQTQQSIQEAPNNLEMAEQASVRSGISYAAALSGQSDNKPAQEEAPSSGFDDIDLDDDLGQNGHAPPNAMVHQTTNAFNDAFGLSAPPTVNNTHQPDVQEELHPADVLAEAFSMSGPPKGKVGGGINPFAVSPAPSLEAHSDGKASPFGQSVVVQQQPQPRDVVSDAFAVPSQDMSNPEPSNMAPDAFSAAPQDSNEPYGQMVTDSFYAPTEESFQPGYNGMVSEAFPMSAPSQEYNPMAAPSQEYNPVAAPSQEYNPMAATSQEYNPMAAPSQEYNPMAATSQEYSPMAAPSQEYSQPEQNNEVTNAFADSAPQSMPDYVDKLSGAFSMSAPSQESYMPVENAIEDAFSVPDPQSNMPEYVNCVSDAPSMPAPSQESNIPDYSNAVEDAFSVPDSQSSMPEYVNHASDAPSMPAPSQESNMPDYSNAVEDSFAFSAQSESVDKISDAFGAPPQSGGDIEGSIDTVSDSFEASSPTPPTPPPPPMSTNKPGGVNPFRRSNTPQHGDAFTESQYTPNGRTSRFANTNVTQEMPVDVNAPFGKGTHMLSSTGKVSPYGNVSATKKEAEVDANNAVSESFDGPQESDMIDSAYNGNPVEQEAPTNEPQEYWHPEPENNDDQHTELIYPNNAGQWPAVSNDQPAPEPGYFSAFQQPSATHADVPTTLQPAVHEAVEPVEQSISFTQPPPVESDLPERDDGLHVDDGDEIDEDYLAETSNAGEPELIENPEQESQPPLVRCNFGTDLPMESNERHFGDLQHDVGDDSDDIADKTESKVSHYSDQESNVFPQTAQAGPYFKSDFPEKGDPMPVENKEHQSECVDNTEDNQPVESVDSVNMFIHPPPVSSSFGVEQQRDDEMNHQATIPDNSKPSKDSAVSTGDSDSSVDTSSESDHSQIEAATWMSEEPSKVDSKVTPVPSTESARIASEASTPPPPAVPTAGPMAMSFRQSREKKSRTPVSTMSSLWSNQNSSAGAPPFMLAPALVKPSQVTQQSASKPVPLASDKSTVLKKLNPSTNHVMPAAITATGASTHGQLPNGHNNQYPPTPPLSQSSPAPPQTQGMAAQVFNNQPTSSVTAPPTHYFGSQQPHQPVALSQPSNVKHANQHPAFSNVMPASSAPPAHSISSNVSMHLNQHQVSSNPMSAASASPSTHSISSNASMPVVHTAFSNPMPDAQMLQAAQPVVPGSQPVAPVVEPSNDAGEVKKIDLDDPNDAGEAKKIDLDDPNLSKKERKAEKKRLKALAKEQKKAQKKAAAAVSDIGNQETKSVTSESQGNPHSGNPSNPPNIPGNPHNHTSGNPHDLKAGNPHGVNSGYPHESVTGNPHNVSTSHPHSEFPGNPHGGISGNPHSSSTGNPHCNPHDVPPSDSHQETPRSESSRIYHGNPHGLEQDPSREHHELGHEYKLGNSHHDYQESRQSEQYKDYDNPRVRELRDDQYYDRSHRQDYSRSKSPLRQSDYKAGDEYSNIDRDSGGYSPRNSRDEGHSRGEGYGANQDSPRQSRDERYHGATRREIEKYGDHSDFDYPKRNRSQDYSNYDTRRSQEDLSYLDRSYESVRSERLPRDEYYHDYYRDRRRDSSGDRLDSNFKPIHHDYRDPYSSHTPSSGSGRSSPASYGNHGNYPAHDQGYYGHYPPYPGYDPYGYYQGHYGHMQYPYYHYPPYPYDYYHQYGAYGPGQEGAYPSGEAGYQEQTPEQTEESGVDKEQQEEEVQEVVPLRTTPLHFLRPHMTCRFGAGGKLLIVLPNHPHDGLKPLVEIQKLKVVFTSEEKDQMAAFPGPLTCRGSMKRQIIEFIQEKTNQIQQSTVNLACKQAKWMLWKFFQSLVKHNGAVVTDDIAEMLMMSVTLFEKKKKKRHTSTDSSNSDSSTGSSSSTSSSSDSTSSDSSEDDSEENTSADRPVDHLLVYRGLLLEGHAKEALEYAMGNALWGHAVLASGLMDNKGNNSMLDTKTSSGVINRFLETLDKGDPLITLYEHLGGQVPHSLKLHENWASNLAGIVANPTAFPDKDKDNIVTLGDTLAKHPDLLFASHLCYLLAGIKPGAKSKMVLVGCDHRNKSLDKMATIESLQLTELLEYATSLENQEFFISNLQMFRFLHALKLMDAGLHKEALSYLHVVGDFIMKNPFAFNDVFKKHVYKTSEHLVGNMESDGASVELFITNWLKKLHHLIEGTESDIFEPQKDGEVEEEEEEEEDPLGQSSVSFYSGYDQSRAYNEQPSPGSTEHSVASQQSSPQSMPSSTMSGPTGHPLLSRKESEMSTGHAGLSRKESNMSTAHSVLSRKESQLSSNSSVAPLQTLDLSQPYPTQIFQPGQPLPQQETFQSQDQPDGGGGFQEDNYQSNQGGFDYQQVQGNDMNNMWIPGSQQNNWPMPTEQGSELSPDNEGEMTPVNTGHTFDDFYHQSNPSAQSWQDENATTPTPGIQEQIAQAQQELPSKPAESKPKQEEKKAMIAKNASGGWFTGLTGLIQKVIPKGTKEVHLPDDTKKKIYFDKDLDKWVNTEGTEEDRAPPPPPPTDAMIGGGGPPGIPSSGPPPPGLPIGNIPSTMSMPTNANPILGNQRNEPGTPPSPGTKAFGTFPNPAIPGMPGSGLPAGPPSKFSRKAQGRFGSQKKYVDVLNPNKGSSQESPSMPSALFPVLPPAGGGSFQGTLFVPSAAPVDDTTDSGQHPSSIQSGGLNEPQPPLQTNDDQNQQYSGSQDYQPPQQQQQQQQSQQTQFFDPSSFSQPPMQSSRRGRGRYPR